MRCRSGPRATRVSPQELKMAKMLVEAMSDNDVDLSQFSDTYTDKLRAMIEARTSGGGDVVASSPSDMSDRVINLMDALAQSLKHAKAERPVSVARRLRSKRLRSSVMLTKAFVAAVLTLCTAAPAADRIKLVFSI